MKIPMTLSIYIARTFLVWFFVVLGAITAIVSLFEFSEFLRRGSGNMSVTPEIVVEMTFLKLPATLEKLLPFVALFSSLLAFWKLNRSNELTVVRATGVSAWQFIAPALVTCTMFGVLSLTVLNPLSSVLKERLDVLESRHFNTQKNSLTFLETGLWLRTVGDNGVQTILRTQKIQENPLSLQNVTIIEQDLEGRLLRRLDARSASFEKDSLNLHQGYITLKGKETEAFKNLLLSTSIDPKILNATQEEPESFSFWDMAQFLPLLEKSGLPILAYQLHWHGLMAQASWLVAMVLLAASCTLRPIRQGGLTKLIFFSLVLGFFLYILRNVAYAMGSSETLPVLLSAWLPTALTFALGSGLLLHFERH